MQGAEIQGDPADSAVLRYGEEPPVRNALAAQGIEIQSDGEHQGAIANSSPEVPNQPARCGQRHQERRSGEGASDAGPAQMRWQRVTIHEFTLSWIP